MKKYSVSTMWDSRAIRPDKTSRVMLSIILPNRSSFKLSLKLFCSKVDYDKALSGRSLSSFQQELRKDISSFVLKAEELIERLPEPTKDTFIKFYKSDFNLSTTSKTDAYYLFQSKIDSLRKEGGRGSADAYDVAMRFLKKFKSTLYLEDLDEPLLKQLKSFAFNVYKYKGKSLSPTTFGIYVRHLRSIYNDAIRNGLISGNKKPFKNLVLASSVKSKSVLYPEQLKQLWNYRSDSIRDRRAIALFFFCYLNNGMNFKDVGMLKYKNIQGDYLRFVREKTKRTKRNQSDIVVYLNDVSRKIIDEWGNPDKRPESFIFQFVPKYNSIKHHEDTIVRYKRYANKSLSRIGRELGFSVHVCLNLARHSFGTKSKMANIPVSIISELLGHASTGTTDHYLKSIPTDMLKVVNNHLLDFVVESDSMIGIE